MKFKNREVKDICKNFIIQLYMMFLVVMSSFIETKDKLE